MTEVTSRTCVRGLKIDRDGIQREVNRTFARVAGVALYASTRGGRDRRISAMLRLKNEEEYLDAAVRSIVEVVDEVVLIDNQSTDDTPVVMANLKSEFPDRVAIYSYDHGVARMGVESWKLIDASHGGRSPQLSADYYNWCLDRCACPYALKWDGDMIALEGLRRRILRWKEAGRPILIMQGANVHSDLVHLADARCTDRKTLLKELHVPGLPAWATKLTYDFPEPRLFPKLFAQYTSELMWVEMLDSPFYRPGARTTHCEDAESPAYLHMKFCKRDPFSAYSPDLAEAIGGNVIPGERLAPEYRRELARWGVALASTRG
jgi:hypothetical protein